MSSNLGAALVRARKHSDEAAADLQWRHTLAEHDQAWLVAELGLLIQAARELRATLTKAEPPPDVATLRDVLIDWDEDADHHLHIELKSMEPPDERAQGWWDEGYRCGILSARADLVELVGNPGEIADGG